MRKKKRERNTQRTCKGKTRYRDHAEAVSAIHIAQSRSTREKIPVRTYECTVCKGWHTTSKEAR